MRLFKTKKSKVAMTCLAVILIASVLCASLAGCKQMYGDTPLGVYFVGDFQKSVDAIDGLTIEDITKDGETIYRVDYALQQAGIDAETNPVAAAAAIYALAVTNYNNITQSGSMLITDAAVVARKALANADISVGIRSTYSAFVGKKGKFVQTVSGVTQLSGIGPAGKTVKTNFGYCDQTFSNDAFTAFRRGNNGGAQFPTEGDIGKTVYKYILGAYNESLTKMVKSQDSKKLRITPADKVVEDPEMDPYVQTATEYPSNSTLKGEKLPDFNPDRNAWDPLNRIPERYWEKNGDKLTGKIIENHAVVEGTRYNFGTYGAGFAVYDFSRPEYLSDDTTVTYNAALDLWTVEVKVKEDYVQKACEFAAGDLVRSTMEYISLKNAQYTEATCKFEVYGNGLIKSLQKKDVLNSNDPCPLVILPGNVTCQGGGTTSNSATQVFSYSDNDTNAERLAKLYWPELGDSKIFSNKKVSTSLKLDLSEYTAFSKYTPVVNTELMNAFTNLFAKKK